MAYLEPSSIGDDDSLSRNEKIRAVAVMVAAQNKNNRAVVSVLRDAKQIENFIKTGSEYYRG